MVLTRRTLFASLVGGLLVYAGSQSAVVGVSLRAARIVETDWGWLEFDGNELSIVSTVEDPPKVRLAALYGRSLGALSFNRLRPDGRQEEVVLMQGKIDERYPTGLGGELLVQARRPGGVGDAAMTNVLLLRSDGVTFYVPTTGCGP